MAIYPAKDVASWLGNSVPVAMAHYVMATEESFRNASGMLPQQNGSIVGDHISDISNAITEETKNEKTLDSVRKTKGSDNAMHAVIGLPMGGTELEKVRAFLGKSNHPESVVLSVVLNDSRFIEVALRWASLDEEQKRLALGFVVSLTRSGEPA